MIKHYEIAACELDIKELVDCLSRMEEKISRLEEKLNDQKTSSSSGMDDLLSRKEVAAYFKVNISTVRNWTRQGILRKYGVGDRVYYKRAEIEEVLIEINETQ